MESATAKNSISVITVAALALFMCVIFAFFPSLAKANYCVYYNTLDDIPENADIFRSIRTGTITNPKINGTWYYRFFEKGYPEVYIKESAFTTKTTNAYLTEDNLKLSQNCQNAPVKDDKTGEWWSVKRVCYYKETSLRDDTPYSQDRTYVYTHSMYRLELNANASSNHHEVVVDAKLTSGVTFDYNARTLKLTRRTEKLPLVPSVVLVVNEGPQVEHYKISGKAPDLTMDDIMDTVGLIWSGASCVGDIKAMLATAGVMVLVPETASVLPKAIALEAGKTALDCGFFLREVDNTLKEADSKELHEFGNIDANSHNVIFTSPLKLKNSENHVRAVYTLNADYNSSTYFKMEFAFSTVKS